MKNYFLISILAFIAIALVSCNNNESSVNNNDEGAGALRITLSGNTAEDGTSRATGQSYEYLVTNYKIYIFNANTETLEAVADGDVSTSTTITGLSTGFAKKVVVVANQPTGFPLFDEGEEYSKFLEAASAIDLDSQDPSLIATNGLVMYGETDQPVHLSASATTNVTVPLKRLVARVNLGSITVAPTDSYDYDQFEITGVSIQRAVSKADIFGNTVSTVPEMYCGELGSWNSMVKTYLKDDLSTIAFPESQRVDLTNYFYVLPNVDADNCTLITVHGMYDGVVQYYPVRINYAATNDQNTDGTYINSNQLYTIHLTINNLAEGSDDPDTIPDLADITVNIEVQNWELTIVQNEKW